MYPVLILRSEFVCLVILFFLFFISRSYKLDMESKSFNRILSFAIIHVCFDMVTVITVNNTEVVPNWMNWICHVIFYISAMMFSSEIAHYVVALCYPKTAKKMYALGHIIISLYICSLSFLKITYVPGVGTYSSAGPAAIVGYGTAFSFFIFALVIIFTHMKQMPTPVKAALIPMMVVLMVTEICQVIWRSVLFTGGAVTIVTVGFFFSLENPVEVFKKKAMTDALTGVQSRRSYEEDIEKLDKRFMEKPNSDHTFVFCDINDLRSVNNNYGHAEGDNYITMIASSIKECMKECDAIYRIGGDEFLAYYYKTADATVIAEILSLRNTCAKLSEGRQYTVAVSTGYATSSSGYKSLNEVVKTADYAMYQNKAKMKSGNAQNESFGIKLNYSGLTDSMFDAVCVAKENIYPFITNMETNVTRISPYWKEYFGLDDVFFGDFLGMWKDHVHPDDLEGYMSDIVSVVTGRKKYHHYIYRARRSDGEYVKVSCHGALFSDSVSGITYFSGCVINHALDEENS